MTDVVERPRLISPPRLRTGTQEHRAASWLELFFDLIFVVAVAQLATLLAKDPSPTGFAGFLLLLVPVWWAWVGYSMYADRFDTDDVVFRLLMAAGMLTVAVIVVAVPAGLGASSTAFALGYALNRFVLIGLYLRAGRHVPPARSLVVVACGAYAVGSALWLASLAVPPTLRPVLWLTAVVAEGAVPWLFRRAMNALPTHATHLPERFGLFTILVLGELLVAVVLGLQDTEWTGLRVAAAGAGFLIAFALWWIYFDALGGARIQATLRARNTFIYAHLPLSVGLVTTAVGIKKAVSGVDRAPTAAAAWLLGGGLALVLISVAVLCVGAVGRRGRGHLVIAGLVLVAMAAAGPLLPGLSLAGVALAVLAAVLTVDVLQRPRAGTDQS